MEMLFQINTRYNYLVGDTNNTQDEYHYTINEQKNQLLLSNNTFSFNHVINESNSILLNNLVNKQIKERDEFNVLYLGKDINSQLKNLLNDICSNKGLVKELQYSIEEINLKENKAIDILDNKKEIHNIKEIKYNTYTNDIKQIELKEHTIVIINCKISYTNVDNVLDCSFITFNLNKETLDILSIFTANYSNKNSMQYLLYKIDSLLSYQNSLTEKISSLPLLSSETLQNINSYKAECTSYYSSIIESFEHFKNDICSNKKESINGQNVSEHFDNFIKSQNELVDKIKNNDEHNIYFNELNAYKNLIDYYVLKETEEMEKGNENGETNSSCYYENLKDLLYRYIDSNEEISRFITKYKSSKEKETIIKEEYNGLNKIIDKSDKEEIEKLNQQINNLIETIKTKDNIINNLKSLKQNNIQVHPSKHYAVTLSIEKKSHFSIHGNNPYNELSEYLSSKFKKTTLICNDLYKEYLDLCKSYTQYREKVLKEQKNRITRQQKVNKRPESPTKTIANVSNDKTISSLKKTISEHEKMISSLKQELEYMKIKCTNLTKEKEQLSEKIKITKIMNTPSPKKEHNLDKSNEINTSIIDTQRRNNNRSKASSKLIASINPNSLMLLNRIKKDNKLIAEQLEFFNKQNAQLQNDLIKLKYNNQEQSSQIGDYINNSKIVKKNLCNSPRTQKKNHKKGHSMFSSSSVTSVKSTGMNNNTQYNI